MSKVCKTALFLSVFIFGITLASCKKEPVSAVPEGMKLVWSDEFDTDGAPDGEKWDYSLGGNGWGNGEIQKYTNKRDNSYIEKGLLNIVAINNNGMWTSARLKTQHKAAWTYGYIEVRAKLPSGVGTWPAIWMMPEFDRYGGWPRSGEIDIMEHVGFDQNRIHTTIHTLDFNHKKNTQKTASGIISNVSKKFHINAINWTPDYIEWFIDGKSFFKFENTGNGKTQWPFDDKFYLILNVAIGGSWGGQQGVDKTLKTPTMQVDYVRVYQAE